MIKIGYAGILQHYEPIKKDWIQGLKDLLWTYRPTSTDPSYRSPSILFQALSLLIKEKKISNQDIQFLLWGNIDPHFQKEIDNLQLEEIVHIGKYLPHQETILSLTEMDILFLPLEKSNSKLHRNLFVPSKLFEYISLNKPILAICEPSETKEILEESGLGIIFSTDTNKIELANTIHQLILNPSLLQTYKRNNQILDKYSPEKATQKLSQIFNQL